MLKVIWQEQKNFIWWPESNLVETAEEFHKNWKENVVVLLAFS